jgi:adenine deaminase
MDGLTCQLRLCYEPAMIGMKQRRTLSDVAIGNLAPDALITHGTLFNAHTAEFIKDQAIWIKDGLIAYVGPDHDPLKDKKTALIDASGMVVLPGLIDAHTHLTGNIFGIEEFIKHVIPTGTTTVITETIELATIIGRAGIECFVPAFEAQPIRLYYTLPPLCGLTPAEEMNALNPDDLFPLFEDPKCVGLGEIYWSNLFLEGKQAERVVELASTALRLGKRVEGHSAGASGRKLQAYTCFGISSCHEPTTEMEILERLRLGYWVMIRQGSIRKELPGVKGIFNQKIDFRRLILCTDGVHPDEFLKLGYLDASLKTALRLGVPVELAYRMVTINPAEHFHLDHLIGSLSPGKMADLVIIPSRREFSPQLVMVGGKIIYRDGRVLAQPRKVTFPDFMFHTVKIPNFQISPLPRSGPVRAMELISGLVTKEIILDLDDPKESEDLALTLALDRLGSGKAFMGFLKGFGLKRGAFASSMCWDSGDAAIVGTDTGSVSTVANRLRELGGGAVYAIGEEVVSELAAPLCGVLSLSPMEALATEMEQLARALKENGVKVARPITTVDTLTTPAIPHLRITHNGYVRVKDREILSLVP